MSKRLTLPQPKLVQTHAGTDQHGERARADLGIELSGITRWNPVEFHALIGDHPDQKIEPSG